MAMVYRLWLYGLQVWIGATCTGGARARGKSRVWDGARSGVSSHGSWVRDMARARVRVRARARYHVRARYRVRAMAMAMARG